MKTYKFVFRLERIEDDNSKTIVIPDRQIMMVNSDSKEFGRQITATMLTAAKYIKQALS